MSLPFRLIRDFQMVIFLFMLSTVIFGLLWGYIPKTEFILNSSANKSVEPYIRVDSVITFSGENPLVVNEVWVGDLVGNLSVTASLAQTSPGAPLLYRKGYAPQRSLESLFWPRDGAQLEKSLRFLGIPLDPVRLARTEGVIAWAFGMPDSSSGLWIEQDQFVILRARLASQVEVRAQSYTHYRRGFSFPKKRIYNWNNGTSAVSEVRKVIALDARNGSAIVKEASSSSLQQIGDPRIQSFYERFR